MTVMNSEVVELCRRMVAQASVNPQDSGRVDFPYGESRMAAMVADWLNKAGLEVQIQQVQPGRENVLATATGKDTSKTLLLSAHMDTVDVKDMVIEPFDPQIRNERIYGRGTCDDKGPLAAMMIAFRDRVRAGNLPCNLALLASCGEEYDLTGSRYFAEHLADISGGGRLYAAVMAEPTELKAVVAHKGVVRLRLVSSGKSAHSSMPSLGKNAIYQMAQALTAVEEFACELAERPGHPRLKTEALSATIVKGGQQINVIPDRCEARIDWRILPGRSPKQCRDELEAVLKAKLRVGQNPTLHRSDEPIKVEIINAYDPMETQADHPVVKSLLSAAEKATGASETIVAGYAT
ncbi:MAG: M20/M25/M40 family metallo-hydrolase, partial [Sedimentisphaerales bacterium]|nr:M20/M25/M40 family metallo-hydrolase [Sedimentisphaerales bacterium]